MSLPAIEVSGLSKHYVIEHESRHDSLRDTLHHTARKLWRRVRWGTSFEKEEFWALRDVSFAVQPGEVVGIVGRNGAGKSTLLKILSRITEPTSGKITLRGRVASLLEVGTGFHPDLTGRENIFLNGAILGMQRAEILRKFDEIVAFAEIERFLDTPVKRYSSGMYVRLAFAVAAHLEPEILIIDEVLAVGDAAFQKKCLGKMQDVATHDGRTILLVSHQMAAIQRLCSRCLVLEGGTLGYDGRPPAAIERYSRSTVPGAPRFDLDGIRRIGGHHGGARLHTVTAGGSRESWTFTFDEHIAFDVDAESFATFETLQLGIGLFSAAGVEIASMVGPEPAVQPGRFRFRVSLGDLRLVPGTYQIGIGLRSPRGIEDYVGEAFALTVLPTETSARMRTEGFGGYAVPRVDIVFEPLAP